MKRILVSLLGYLFVLFNTRFWYLILTSILPARDMSTKYGKWFSVSVCYECEKQLTDEEIYFNDNTCPYCGATGGIYPLATKMITMRKVKTPILRGTETSYEGKGYSDKEWLLKEER